MKTSASTLTRSSRPHGSHRRAAGLLALAEAHDLLTLLLPVAQDDGPVLSQADRPAREIAARIPSED
ncbi:DUF6417 family protein [Streptomyces europaeiscabiei]|uniref:DUF6417 family protein n=1 Tax=Streptomyces europaeiscabiei TaxID=146819 RepID=UPI0039A6372C